MNQNERIIAYMREYGGITQDEAGRCLGCARLASRISEIKRQGYSVKTTMVHGKNRYGEPVHFARYSLEVQ